MTVKVRIIRHCPPVMSASGESVDPSVGEVVEVQDHTAALLVRQGLAEQAGDDQ